jgi:hypothetical protein
MSSSRRLVPPCAAVCAVSMCSRVCCKMHRYHSLHKSIHNSTNDHGPHMACPRAAPPWAALPCWPTSHLIKAAPDHSQHNRVRQSALETLNLLAILQLGPHHVE